MEKNVLTEVERQRIRELVEIYYDCQAFRIAAFNRLRTVGIVEGVHPERLLQLEKEIRDYIEKTISGIPIYENFLKQVKGIGPILAGALLAYLDPAKAEHASSFWRYMGFHVVDGKAPRFEKGKKAGYSKRLHVLGWKIGDSFIKQRTPKYREIYDLAKNRENEKLGFPVDFNGNPGPIATPEKCKFYQECKKIQEAKAKRLGRKPKPPPCAKHIHFRALRKAIKQFLADLWVEWRTLMGLPVSDPYAIAILKHQPTTSQKL